MRLYDKVGLLHEITREEERERKRVRGGRLVREEEESD